MVSGSEILLIFLAFLVLFGADKIPGFAKTLGKGLRELKKATDEIKNEINKSSSGAIEEIKQIRQDITDNIHDIAHTTSNGLIDKNEAENLNSKKIIRK
jgi:sec-independent protein translocase protein TatA